MTYPWPLAIAVAFLCGSIPFGFLIGRMRGVDIREHGSRNIGATNVGRVLGRRIGLLCFVLDALKGLVPTALAGIMNNVAGNPIAAIEPSLQWLWLATAAAALLGHMFPPWLRFKGGKGVATGFGALLGIYPGLTFAAVAALVTWLLLLGLFRYVSLASMLAALVIPTFVAAHAALAEGGSDGVRAALPMILATAAIAALVVYRHRSNIARLRRGEEPKVGRSGRRGA